VASYHCEINVGARGKAGPHSAYISRTGKYAKSQSDQELIYLESGNMPSWAKADASIFWESADQYERANGAAYREKEIALPRELTPDQRLELVREFVRDEIGDRHAYTFAIHMPKAALEGGEQPHAHIMYSERTNDGIERNPDQYFKRYNAKKPEIGGCRKDSAGTEERLLATRANWARVQNEHLAKHGHTARVDHRSLKDQGIDRAPERHLGAKRIQQNQSETEISAVLERRAAEGALQRAEAELQRSFISLSTDIAAAKADLVAQKIEAFARKADGIEAAKKRAADDAERRHREAQAEMYRAQREAEQKAVQERSNRLAAETAKAAQEVQAERARRLQSPRPKPEQESGYDGPGL
jgi:hypothetical protein